MPMGLHWVIVGLNCGVNNIQMKIKLLLEVILIAPCLIVEEFVLVQYSTTAISVQYCTIRANMLTTITKLYFFCINSV